jgi:hypothetical protein
VRTPLFYRPGHRVNSLARDRQRAPSNNNGTSLTRLGLFEGSRIWANEDAAKDCPTGYTVVTLKQSGMGIFKKFHMTVSSHETRWTRSPIRFDLGILRSGVTGSVSFFVALPRYSN